MLSSASWKVTTSVSACFSGLQRANRAVPCRRQSGPSFHGFRGVQRLTVGSSHIMISSPRIAQIT